MNLPVRRWIQNKRRRRHVGHALKGLTIELVII